MIDIPNIKILPFFRHFSNNCIEKVSDKIPSVPKSL